ncbi:peptidase inhibitor family I36 protein [Streptomyces sp. NPDC004542]|uniref:peptidase inhibitor family I36 protein n=1 Tax=Streptomyces sp. NPDC004542 TaxID=3154281 RepID=UPI0033A88868
MTSFKRLARSAGVTVAAGWVGVAVMTAPAHAVGGGCAKNYTCVWSQEHFRGRAGKIGTRLGQCYSSRSVGARSIDNNTRHMLALYARKGCKGRVFPMNWGVKAGDGFPFGVMSFKAAD